MINWLSCFRLSENNYCRFCLQICLVLNSGINPEVHTIQLKLIRLKQILRWIQTLLSDVCKLTKHKFEHPDPIFNVSRQAETQRKSRTNIHPRIFDVSQGLNRAAEIPKRRSELSTAKTWILTEIIVASASKHWRLIL